MSPSRKADPLTLVVEGKNDQHVMYALFEYHKFQPRPTVEEEGGYENLRDKLSNRLKENTYLERLGIIVDADTSPVSRWDAIKAILLKAGYVRVPNAPDPDGIVINHDILPRVGVWIMPDNILPGILENYLSYLVPANDPLFKRATDVLNAFPPEDWPFSEVARPKALIHTWLAWQKEPGKPLGQAVTAFMNKDVPHAARLLDWLTRVFA